MQGCTWKEKRRSLRYSSSRSSIRTICEKISTRWPPSLSRNKSLSNKISLPLLFTRVCRGKSLMHKLPVCCFCKFEEIPQIYLFLAPPREVEQGKRGCSTSSTPWRCWRSWRRCPSCPWSALGSSSSKSICSTSSALSTSPRAESVQFLQAEIFRRLSWRVVADMVQVPCVAKRIQFCQPRDAGPQSHTSHQTCRVEKRII